MPPIKAQKYWGEIYTASIEYINNNAAEKILEDRSISEIHAAVLASTKFSDLQALLNASSNAIRNLLNDNSYNGEKLDYKKFKNITIEEANAFWKNDYHQPFKNENSKNKFISAHNLAAIHEVILNSKNANQAALQLNTDQRTLEANLKKCFCKYHDLDLSFEILKQISADKAKEIWGNDYYQPLKNKSLKEKKQSLYEKFLTLTVAQVHHSLKHDDEKNIKKICLQLSTNKDTLDRSLARIATINNIDIIMDSNALRKLTNLQAETIFGNYYNLPFKEIFETDEKNRNKVSLEKIHTVILKTESIGKAANALGFSINKLRRELSSYEFELEPLTYDALKSIDANQARAIFGIDYNRNNLSKPKIFDLDHTSLYKLHTIAHEVDSINAMAARLQTDEQTLLDFFDRIQPSFKHYKIDYYLLKFISQEEAQSFWGKLYFDPVKTNGGMALVL